MGKGVSLDELPGLLTPEFVPVVCKRPSFSASLLTYLSTLRGDARKPIVFDSPDTNSARQ
jgi:hypothetical protein